MPQESKVKIFATALVISLLASTNAFAGEITAPHLVCATSGIGLAELSIDQGPVGGVVWIQKSEVSEGDEEPVILRYSITSGFKDVVNGTSATVVAESPSTEQVGNISTDSILIRILDGQKRAVLAIDGNVIRLQCHKPTL